MSHLEAIEAAMASDRALGQIFEQRLGTAAQPEGEVLQAYERARLGLAGADGDPVATARVMGQLRSEVTAALAGAVDEATAVGVTQAQRTLEAFGLPSETTTLRIDTVAVLRQLLTIVEQQELAATSGLLDTAELIGDGARVGLVSHGALTAQASRWLATVSATAVEQIELANAPEVTWARQAVAAIDENTTPCCLGVHGQIVGIDEPFRTPLPPAFAGEQSAPPFHNWCRTVLVLVPRELAEDELTRDMQLAARLEREARERPEYVAPHPANAFTRVRE